MNETLQTIQRLRSIRHFTEKPISQEDLDIILKASISAANSSSRQCYSIIVLKDQAKMQAVCGYKGAAALVYCVDYNRLKDISEYMGEQNAMNAPIDLITGSTDTVLAMQTAVIAAKSLGIDSLITNGVHRQDFTKIYQLLELPEQYCFPLAVLVLGYSDAKENHNKERVTKGVIHKEVYHHLTISDIEEEIRFFDFKNKLGGSSGLKGWVEEGFKHYYNWFFQKWNGQREDIFTPVLVKTGFLKNR